MPLVIFDTICSCLFSEPRMHQSQNFALQIGLELIMDRDPLPQNPATIERPLLTAYCTVHPPCASSPHVGARFFNAGYAPDNLPA